MAKTLKKTLISLIIVCFFAQSTGMSYALRPAATKFQKLEKTLQAFIEQDEYPFDFERQLLSNPSFVINILRNNVFFPPEIDVHPTSICNLNCMHCIGASKKPVQKFSLTKKELLGIVEDMNIYNLNLKDDNLRIKRIKFSGETGEPLINPNTKFAIRKAIEDGYEVGLLTNGTQLAGEIRQTMMGAKFICISLDAASTKVFSKLKGVNENIFNLVLANIKKLVELKKDQNSDLEIGMGFVLSPVNYREVGAFIELAKDAGVDYARIRAPFGVMAKAITSTMWEEIHTDLHRQAHLADDLFGIFFVNETDDKKSVSDFHSCPAHAFLAFIEPQGNVFPCCLVTQPSTVSFGNIKHSGLMDIWFGKAKEGVLKQLDPSKICPACPSKAARINKLLHFLIKEQGRNPDFSNWLSDWLKTYEPSKKVTVTDNRIFNTAA